MATKFPSARALTALLAAGLATTTLAGCPMWNMSVPASENIAQEWMTLMLDAQEFSAPRPTVVSRQLWYVSAGMYESWAVYDEEATGYFTGHRLTAGADDRTPANRAETLSHATYALLTRYYAPLAALAEGTPGRAAYDAFAAKMRLHGYLDIDNNPVSSDAQALGTEIAEIVLDYAATDGSNEANNYTDTSGFQYLNPSLVVLEDGTQNVTYPDIWQTLILPSGAEQRFLTPHWGRVEGFALPPFSLVAPRIDPGPPPFLETDAEEFINQFLEVVHFSAALDPIAGPGVDTMNASPAARGNNSLGANDGSGYEMNPITRAPYADVIVPKGDWLRAIAEYWADGPHSETPPGHWGRLAIDVSRGAGIVTEHAANKAKAADLEYDVKLFFVLNAALHDAAIATWDLKEFYNFTRPISAIRYLAEAGMFPVEEGAVETIQEGDPLAGAEGEHVGETKIFAWLGPDAGCGWMRALEWLPYQAAGFVTPAFPGYTSGHSCFSRAAADTLTRYTEDPFFPGGLAVATVNTLNFEAGPTVPVPLQWAKYYDASDEAGISRLCGGIHISADDFNGRRVGADVAERVFEKATDYFEGRGVAVAKHFAE